MKALARTLLSPIFWLLAPVMEWAAVGNKVRFEYGIVQDRAIYFQFTDAAGVHYSWEKDPESARDMAWKLINAADRIDMFAEYN